MQISDTMIKTLIYMLNKEETYQVREVVAAAIGQIGIPEGLQTFESLAKIIDKEEEEPNVKAMAVWAIGRLACPEISSRC